MTQPKPTRLEDLQDTCGSCRHGHDLSGEVFILCYGNPPALLQTESGSEWQQRGAPVEAGEPCCHLFSPRCRA